MHIYTGLVMFACSSVSEAERVQALIDRNATRHGKVDSVSKRVAIAFPALHPVIHSHTYSLFTTNPQTSRSRDKPPTSFTHCVTR
jgi:hypothetical protein